MVVLRLVVMMIVEVLKELTRRLGHPDLSEKCVECEKEIEAADEALKKEG
jgi:hypothetical protein